MLRFSHCLLALVCTAQVAFTSAVAAAGETGDSSRSPRPNIIVILVDDMGYSDVGCYGGEIETPNIDALASGGLRFTQFYNSGRCCPTRASLMTGLHPHQVGIGHMTEPPEQPLGFDGAYQGYLNDKCTTIAEVLRGAGYRTLMTGKWHLGYNRRDCWPLQRGFEKFYGCLAGGFNYFHPDGNRGIYEGNTPVEVGDDFYATDTLTDVACQYIEELESDDDSPFFLYLAYNAPHWPLNSKWEEFQKYRGKYRGGWDELIQSRWKRQQELGLFNDVTPAIHEGPEWSSLNKKQRDRLDAVMAAYAGCIDSIDQNVGKLVAKLEVAGELDNTLICFLSDNGSCQEGGTLGRGDEAMVKNPPGGVAGVRLGRAWAGASNTPFRLYKHFVHEGGASTPMIAHWPSGIPKAKDGGFVRQFAYLPDFMATFIELSGAEYPAELPSPVGNSFAHVLNGSDDPIHESAIYWEHEGNAAMRDGDFKLVREYNKPWELFNLAEDRTEMVNLATAMPDRRDAMVAAWEAWASENDVAFPKRFNMYEYLKKKDDPGKKADAKKNASAAGVIKK